MNNRRAAGELIDDERDIRAEILAGLITDSGGEAQISTATRTAGKLKYVGKVRAGFVSHMRCAMMPLLQELGTDECPFADLPEKRRTVYSLNRDEMQECHWLQPLLVAQIEVAEWTPDGHLRHSSFAGLRSDKDAARVVRE